MFKKVVLFVVPLAAMAGPAFATDPWAGVSSLEISTAPYTAGVLVILGALAAIWIGRKLIKLWNKS